MPACCMLFYMFDLTISSVDRSACHLEGSTTLDVSQSRLSCVELLRVTSLGGP